MSFIITPEVANRELSRRKGARAMLKTFASNIDIPGVPLRADDPLCEVFKPVETPLAAHHVLICDAVQRAMANRNGRLMIFTCPGAAKSSYVSVTAPAWFMGQPRDGQVGIFSYSDDIAIHHSRRARAICRDPRYANYFHGATLSNDKSAADKWQLTNGSEMLAGGIRTGITGFRLAGAIIDDPVKNREEADSEGTQSKNFDEYNDTITTRLVPGGFIIIVQTLWSQLDLSMRLLPEDWHGESGRIKCQDGQTWEVICLPAKYEADMPPDPLGRKPGEYLWPEWFTAGHFDKWEFNPRARRTWSALYQQRPTPKEGLQFTRSMFKRFDLSSPPSDDGDDNHLPATLNRYGASDYATLDDAKADFTEHGCAGMDWKGDLWFVDWWYGQKETDKSIEAFINVIWRNKPLRWANEGGTIDHAIRPAINRAMREKQKFVLIESFPSIQDKSAKLMSFHARASAGTVHVPNTPWGDRLIDQLCAFPAVKHDDACDVAGLIGRLLDVMAEGALPRKAPRDTVTPFTEAWFTAGDEKPRGPKFTSGG